MNFLEKDLEEIIYNADKELLAKKGLYVSGILKRQLRIGNYGTADLVSFHRSSHPASKKIDPILTITVYELKKENINVSSFLQALGYTKGIKRYLEKRNFKFEYEFEIVLIGKEIDTKSTFSYLEDIIPCNFYFATRFLSFYTYSYNIDGIEFNLETDYKLANEGF
jgi:hypothetical protein